MARRKIGDAKELANALPELTPQRMMFVAAMLSGKTASDAYRHAYNCENSKDTTIWANASRLHCDADIQAWLSASRQAGLGTARVTLDSHLQQMERLRELAVDTGNVGAAVQAEQLRGKAAGHYTERLEVSTTDPLETLKQLEAISPELARKLAQDNNIDWPEQRLTEH